MAEIHVEQKRRSLGWLWALLALLVIGALAWYFFMYMGGTTTGAPAPATGLVPAAAELAARALAVAPPFTA